MIFLENGEDDLEILLDSKGKIISQAAVDDHDEESDAGKAMNPTKTESAKATGFTRFLIILLAIIAFGSVAVAAAPAGDRRIANS